MINIHHLDKSRSLRILWLMEELGQPYELVSYYRAPFMAPPELARVHPLGKAPVIEENGVTIAESGAIVEFIMNRYGHGRLAPAPDALEWPRYIEWLHYAEGSFIKPIGQALLQNRWSVTREMAAYNQVLLDLHMGYVSAALENSLYLMGEMFTAADILMTFPLQLAQAASVREPWPILTAYVVRMEARPAYKRAEERGGSLELQYA